jgi:hypothetical protein
MDGKPSVKQDIEAVRHNNPDTIAAYGEFTDNSVSWGKCDKGSIILGTRDTTVVDNGTFNKERFPSAFCKMKSPDDDKTHYNANTGFGKYNWGLTDSTILLGNSAELFTRFGPDDYKKTVFDTIECMKQNKYISNETSLTPDEKNRFIEMQTRNDPEYDTEEGRGSVLIIKDLEKANTKKSFIELTHFFWGLYSEKCLVKAEWKLFNWTNPEECSDKCNHIISPNNLMFGCKTWIDKPIYVYYDDDDKLSFEEKKIKGKHAKYKFNLKSCFFEREHVLAEHNLFGPILNGYRVGFQVRRGGRLLTGIEPKLWNMSTGMNHANGFRVFIDLPINWECDKLWCIGTFKKITDDSWKNFSQELKDFIKSNFSDMVKVEEKDRKKKQKDFQIEYDKKYETINQFKKLDDLKNEHTIHSNIMDLIMKNPNDKRLNKKGTSSYKSITRYLTELDTRIKQHEVIVEPEPDEPKPVEPEPVEPEPVEPKPVEPEPDEPKPVEPEPVEPEPDEPKPVELEPVELEPDEPKPVEPKPDEPEPVEPEPVEPKPDEPEPVEPEPVEPEPVEPEPVLAHAAEVKTKLITINQYSDSIADDILNICNSLTAEQKHYIKEYL